MRSAFAYIPRRGPLQQARVGAAVSYLGALVVVAFLYSNPLVLVAAGLAACMAGWLAGARSAVRAALRMGLGLALLIVVVNALLVDRGETVLARLGHWPLLGQVDITLEAIVAGVSIGLRAAVTMVAFAVYSACVDPDRVLRALRPLAARSARSFRPRPCSPSMASSPSRTLASCSSPAFFPGCLLSRCT